MVLGYPNAQHNGLSTFSAAREWLSEKGHKTFRFCRGPSDGDMSVAGAQHRGRSGCYTATDAKDATIFENCSDVKIYATGCKNSAQEGYADLKTAKAVLWEIDNIDKGVGEAWDSQKEETGCCCSSDMDDARRPNGGRKAAA
ncbi:hypothetical protein DHEL01_v208689 [Diaporthe helianthi]|uniref:Uncharacterized protein n=1 Tax=Diaporthe helianthi TaxID=158607 RepID=A0A2P5HRN5_DIAHE|nr:hypothetical protein DHEL01_v208689 [Diaporthe helianthi]